MNFTIHTALLPRGPLVVLPRAEITAGMSVVLALPSRHDGHRVPA